MTHAYGSHSKQKTSFVLVPLDSWINGRLGDFGSVDSLPDPDAGLFK